MKVSAYEQDKEELIMQVRKAKYGDKEAFCNLIRINKVAIYRIAKSILTKEEDIEDAVSEAILKAYKNIKTLKNDDFFKTWLIRIVINESNNLYKKRQREIAFEKDHFLPRSIFPTLTISSLNFTPICATCNSASYKGESAPKLPIIIPNKCNPIEEYITFRLVRKHYMYFYSLKYIFSKFAFLKFQVVTNIIYFH